MKKVLLTIVVLFAVFALLGHTTAYAASASFQVEPPKVEDFDYLAQLVVAVVTLMVTYGLKFLVKEWGLDLTGKSTQITAVIVGLIYETANQWLALVPPDFYPVVVSAAGLITAVLVAFGTSGLIKKFSTPSKSK